MTKTVLWNRGRRIGAVGALGAVLALLVLGWGGPAVASGPPPSNDTIISSQGPLSRDGSAPTPVTLPLVLSGHTTNVFPPTGSPSTGRGWNLVMDGDYAVSGDTGNLYVYCSNSPITDPSTGYGEYGTPPFDANGNWTCDVATDPNAASDGLNLFDPNDPRISAADAPWWLWDNFGQPTVGGSPTYYLTFAPVVGTPVVWWPAGLLAGAAFGGGFWLWRWRAGVPVVAGRWS